MIAPYIKDIYSLNLLVGFCSQYFQILPKIIVCSNLVICELVQCYS